MSEQSIYGSSTHGKIPLSFEARRLMQNLRLAIADAITHQDFMYREGAVSYARGELAKYMSGMEQRLGRNPPTDQPYAGQTVTKRYGWKIIDEASQFTPKTVHASLNDVVELEKRLRKDIVEAEKRLANDDGIVEERIAALDDALTADVNALEGRLELLAEENQADVVSFNKRLSDLEQLVHDLRVAAFEAAAVKRKPAKKAKRTKAKRK